LYDKRYELIKEIIHRPDFPGIHCGLLLTKSDEFERKLTSGIRLSSYFPEYKGENDFLSASEFIIKRFEDRKINLIFTTGLDDPLLAQNIFNFVKDCEIRNGLEESGIDPDARKKVKSRPGRAKSH